MSRLLIVPLLLLLCPLIPAQRDLSMEQITVQKRLALVVGNAAYAQSPLKNPVHDADGMSAALRGMNFEVIDGRDVTLRRLEQLVDQFTVRLRSGDLGLFYYAGHGAQVQFDNYLIPV